MELIAQTLFFLIAGLLGIVALPPRIANKHPQALRRLVTTIIGFVFLTSLTFAVTRMASGSEPFTIRLVEVSPCWSKS